MRAAILALLAACGEGSSTHAPDAAKPIDAAPDGPSGFGLPQGLVELTQGTSMGTANAGADATLSTVSFLGPAKAASGACIAFATASPPPRESAGTITIVGGTMPFTLQPSGTSPTVSYSAGTITSPSFQSSHTITFTAAGGPDVPAFSGSVVAPALLTGYTPPTSVSRAGYTATWPASSASEMWLILVGSSQSGTDALLCRVPDNGSFTVTSAQLGLLAASDTMIQIALGRLASTTVSAGGKTIELAATSYISGSQVPFN